MVCLKPYNLALSMVQGPSLPRSHSEHNTTDTYRSRPRCGHLVGLGIPLLCLSVYFLVQAETVCFTSSIEARMKRVLSNP